MIEQHGLHPLELVFSTPECSGVRRKKFRGVQGRGSGIVGGRSPPNAGEFSKICKKIHEENCQKCCIFAYFVKKFQKHAVNFRAFERKNNYFGIFEKTLKIFYENSMEKLNFSLFSGSHLPAQKKGLN